LWLFSELWIDIFVKLAELFPKLAELFDVLAGKQFGDLATMAPSRKSAMEVILSQEKILIKNTSFLNLCL
jgi:hypothetical protein